MRRKIERNEDDCNCIYSFIEHPYFLREGKEKSGAGKRAKKTLRQSREG